MMMTLMMIKLKSSDLMGIGYMMRMNILLLFLFRNFHSNDCEISIREVYKFELLAQAHAVSQ